MKKKLAIYCDCDSDSGMLTYTLMLLAALKNHTDISTLVISSSPRNNQEQVRLDKLQKDASELQIISREHKLSKHAATEMAKILIGSSIDFYIPNYRYMPHLVLSYLPRHIKNVIIVHNDTDEIYQSIRFYRSVIDGVIFPSRAAFSKSEKTVPDVSNKVCIPHYFSPLGKVNPDIISKPRITIVYHGRLAHTQKKSMELLNIAGEMNKLGIPFDLKIIGTGDALKEIQERIQNEAIENIKLVGQLSRDNLIRELQDADIALSTSTYEGFCYSVAESLSLGVVPVVYENEVLHDLIQEGVNGYLIPWGRADLLALKIQELYHHQDRLASMSKAAAESVQSLISAKRYADQMIEFLNILTKAPNGKPWPLFRPRGLAYDTAPSRIIAKLGRKLNFW
jgi:glycosyltransferase involved in cell wall biosynthesis